MMKWALIGLVAVATFAVTGSSFAVSDGHYRPSRNHCTNFDDNSDNPKYVNPDCKSLIMTLSDGTGHEYFGAGTRQTPDGTFAIGERTSAKGRPCSSRARHSGPPMSASSRRSPTHG